MDQLGVSDILRVTGGKLLAGRAKTALAGASTDSRTVGRGDLFFPIKGERHDGMAFVRDALAAGASGSLVTRWNEKIRSELNGVMEPATVIIKVDSGLAALQRLASYVRTQLDAEVVGITGSTGKTTTKDFLAAMLGRKKQVVAAERSFNNEVGVPITILRASRRTQVVVVEMAMRGRGQIEQLANIARPTVGLVTNVGKTHLEFLGSEEQIAEAKAELVASIPPDGVVVLNADDYWTHKIRATASAKVVTYGTAAAADVRAIDIEVDDEGRASFQLRANQRRKKIRLPVLGKHNAYNFCAAAAVALALGIDMEDIGRSLADVSISEMRMQQFVTADDVVVLNDAYNANPTSMKSALETLGSIATGGKRIAVLGDMTELGRMTDVAHFQVGELAAKIGIDMLVTVGERSARIADGAMVHGMDSKQVRRCAATEEAARHVKKALKPSDVVLVKASRVMKLEEVVNALT